MAALAEKLTLTSAPEPIAALLEDDPARVDAGRFIRGIGRVSLIGVEDSLDLGGQELIPIASLAEGIDRAQTDPVAYKMVRSNVRAEGLEQTLKAGHVLEALLMTDTQGVIYQHNQTLRDVHGNALMFASEHPKMRERSEAETTNGFMLQRSYRRGELKGQSFVVFSLTPDNMTEKEMDDAGFFTETMSLTVQLVTEQADGQLLMESAFVAGVKQPGGNRHDIKAVKRLAKKLELNFDDLTVTGMVASPTLIDNQHIPNGVIDLVAMLDSCIDDVTGSTDTFFGQPKGKRDYQEYRQYCRDRELEFEPKIEAATYELITTAHGSDEVEAIRRLHKITEKHMVEMAVFNTTIDPWVFGKEAAGHILMARWHLEQGNIALAVEQTELGQSVAASKSCPSSLKHRENSKKETGEEESNPYIKDCEFESKECPLCKAKNVKTRVSKIDLNGQKLNLIRGGCGCYKMSVAA